MIRNAEGRRVICLGAQIARPDERVKTTWVTPESIIPRQIKYRLCKDGPNKCVECGLCAFGRWYVEHNMGEEKGPEKALKMA